MTRITRTVATFAAGIALGGVGIAVAHTDPKDPLGPLDRLGAIADNRGATIEATHLEGGRWKVTWTGVNKRPWSSSVESRTSEAAAAALLDDVRFR